MKNYSKALKRVAEVLYAVKSEKEMGLVLEDLLTPAEIHDIDERAKIFKSLIKGDSQRTVAKKLGVSVAKVSRGAHALQYGAGGIEKLFSSQFYK